MDMSKRNKNLGLAVLITGYLTLIFWLLGIFLSVEIGIGWESYTAVGFFGLLMIASGIIFLLSLIFNIIESRENKRISRGLLFTIISIPPIAFCYLAILVKALTEGH
jgi:ethanolamine transporter EutH